MRKSVAKEYPVYDHPEVNSGDGSEWFQRNVLGNIPQRFAEVLHRRSKNHSDENFLMFDGDIGFNEDSRHCLQDAWFMYEEEPIIITHRTQMRNNLPEGDVDFYVRGPISLPGGMHQNDPNSGRPMRYPYRVATYLPIRNVLAIKNFFHEEPTPSMLRLLAWIFEIIETVGYKYNSRGEALLIGCDPEFNIADMMDERIYANTLFSTDPEAEIGCDGHSQTGELRPKPASCPLALTENINQLMHEIAKDFGNDKKLQTGGGGDIDPIGHHIHFNKMLSSDEITLLDEFVGRPALGIKGAKRMGGDYETLGAGAVRRQPHGCEYRTPASSLIPELTAGIHVTAWCCVRMWEELPEGEEFIYDTDDNSGIPTLGSYLDLDTSRDKRYQPHLEEFWKWGTGHNDRKIDPKRDCLHMWVEGREEVRPKPGVKVSWSTNIHPNDDKPRFIHIPEMEAIFDFSMFLLPSSDETEGKVLQVCIDPDEKGRVSMGELVALKSFYNIDKIIGFDHPTRKLGFTEDLLEAIGNYSKLESFLIAFAKVLCK